MSNMFKRLRIIFSYNWEQLRNILIIAGIFFTGMLVSSALGDKAAASVVSMGLVALVITYIAMLPFVNQFRLFPYAVNLGWRRGEYMLSVFIYNILFSAGAVLLLNLISRFCSRYRIGFTTLYIPTFYQGVSRVLFASGISCVLTLSALVLYRYKFLYGFSFLLLILSPVVLYRYRLIELLEWHAQALIILSLITAALGILSALASGIIIKSTEVN